LFEAFRKEVSALDPCVTEEFLKNYVAYRAETNFVDLKPQIKGLRLALNMLFSEINDLPRWRRTTHPSSLHTVMVNLGEKHVSARRNPLICGFRSTKLVSAL